MVLYVSREVEVEVDEDEMADHLDDRGWLVLDPDESKQLRRLVNFVRQGSIDRHAVLAYAEFLRGEVASGMAANGKLDSTKSDLAELLEAIGAVL